MIIGKLLGKKGVEVSKKVKKTLSKALASRNKENKDKTIASPVNERTELADGGVAPKMTVKVIRFSKAPMSTQRTGRSPRGRFYKRTIIE